MKTTALGPAGDLKLFLRRWSFGLGLLLFYLAIFNFWRVADPRWILPSCIIGSALWLGLLGEAARRRYFFNAWETLLHGLVILDIFLEGTLLREHEARGFYWCALGFAIVIGAYRWYLFKRNDKGQGSVTACA